VYVPGEHLPPPSQAGRSGSAIGCTHTKPARYVTLAACTVQCSYRVSSHHAPGQGKTGGWILTFQGWRDASEHHLLRLLARQGRLHQMTNQSSPAFAAGGRLSPSSNLFYFIFIFATSCFVPFFSIPLSNSQFRSPLEPTIPHCCIHSPQSIDHPTPTAERATHVPRIAYTIV